MAREYRYELRNEPVARDDGTKAVAHNITAVYREAGSGDPWAPVPEHHVEGLNVPGDELLTALSAGTNNQKVKKYKDLIRTALDAGGFVESFERGWEEAKLEEFMANNDISIAAAASANEFITVTLNQTFPIYFELGG